MALKLLAIGCVKSGHKICGYRLIDYNEAISQNAQNCQVKYLDLPSSSIINAMRSNQVVVDNLSITNGELKGSNGQASRYGIVDASTLKAKNQVMVIVAEVKDTNGYLVGYICSDTNGSIVRLLAEQAVLQAAKMGLATGKLVDNGNGEKHISAIYGGYSALRLNYDYISKFKKQMNKAEQRVVTDSNNPVNRSDTNADTNVGSKTATNADNKNKVMTPDELYAKALETIKELEQYKAFKADFSYKIAVSVKRWHKCSEKQLGVLERALTSFRNNNAEKIEPDTSKENVEKKACIEDTHQPDIVQDKKQEEVKKPKNENKFAAGIKPVEVENNTDELNSNTQQSSTGSDISTVKPQKINNKHDEDTNKTEEGTDIADQ